jgi:hypothetical protein
MRLDNTSGLDVIQREYRPANLLVWEPAQLLSRQTGRVNVDERARNIREAGPMLQFRFAD